MTSTPIAADRAAPAAPRASWFARLTGRSRDRDVMLPLYEAIVKVARNPFWYRDGKVPDTVDGRFDMIAALTALVLIRLEAIDDPQTRSDSAWLTEIFIADMDESLRQIGVGDYVVGKYVGRMVSALGGRLNAFREGIAAGDFAVPVDRNIFHEAAPDADLIDRVADRLYRFHQGLGGLSRDDLAAARLPAA